MSATAVRRRVVVIGVPGFNRGDDAISDGLVQALLDSGDDVRLTVGVLRHGVHAHASVDELLIVRRSPAFHLRLALAIWRSDLVVIGGGSIIQDEFGAGWVQGIMGLYVEVALLARWLRRAVRTAPLGIDALRSDKGRRVARFILGGCARIDVRDAASKQRVEQLFGDGREVALAADPALAIRLPARERPAPDAAAPTLVMCPAFERGNALPTPRLFASIAERFLRSQPQGRVVLLAMDERAHEDAGHLREIVDLLDADLRARVEPVAPQRLDTTLSLLRVADWLVTMRLHPMILAARAVPTLCLARGPKMTAIADEMAVDAVDLRNSALAQVVETAGRFIDDHRSVADRARTLDRVKAAGVPLMARWQAHVDSLVAALARSGGEAGRTADGRAMRILMVSANYGGHVVGGAQVSMQSVADELARRGHVVRVCSIEDGQEDRADWRNARVERRTVAPANLYWRPATARPAWQRLAWHLIDRAPWHQRGSLLREIDAFKPDLVHTNVLAGLGVGPWRAAGARGVVRVHTVHDYYVLCANSGMRKAAGNCDRPCAGCKAMTSATRAASQDVEGVIYVSAHMARAHAAAGAFGGATATAVIPGAYDLPAVLPPPLVAADPGERPLRLGYLGRLAPDKGVVQMLQALALAPAGQWQLLVGGIGEARFVERLHVSAAALPVSFLGRVEPAAFLQSIDVLVVSSLWQEPAGRVIFEAGLHGVPSIVTNRGGQPEMIDHGALGWIYDPTDPAALGRLVAELVADRDAIEARRLAWAQQAGRYAVAAAADATLALYQQACASRRDVRGRNLATAVSR